MKLKAAAAALVVGGLVACNSAEKQADATFAQPSAETNAAAREANASHVAEVTFDKGSFVLTETSRAALTELVRQASATGKIDDVKVLAFADAAYPSDAKKELSKGEQDLAKKRAEAISTFLKSELKVGDVDTYNMAERPNAIQKLVNSPEARMKRSLENAGVTSNEGKSLFGKTSRAVVMVMLNE